MADLATDDAPPPCSDPRSRESTTFDPPTYEIRYAFDHTLEWDPPQGSKELALALSYHFPMEKDLESKMRAATKKFLKAEAKKHPLSLGSILQKTKVAVVRASQEVRSVQQRVSVNASSSKPQQRSPALSEELDQTVRSELRDEPRSLELGNPHSTLRATPTGYYDTPGKYPEFSVWPLNLGQFTQPSTAPLEILKWNSGVNTSLKRRKKRQYVIEERAKVAANRGNACAEHQRKKMKCDPQTCPQNKQNLMKLSVSQSRDEDGQSKDAESAETSNAVTMVRLALLPEHTGMTTVSADKSLTIERNFQESMDTQLPVVLDTMTGFESKAQCHLANTLTPADLLPPRGLHQCEDGLDMLELDPSRLDLDTEEPLDDCFFSLHSSFDQGCNPAYVFNKQATALTNENETLTSYEDYFLPVTVLLSSDFRPKPSFAPDQQAGAYSSPEAFASPLTLCPTSKVQSIGRSLPVGVIPPITQSPGDMQVSVEVEFTRSQRTQESPGPKDLSSTLHHSPGSRKNKGGTASTKIKKDDWSEVTSPDERRRVRARIASRKFHKAKEAGERQNRELEDRAHSGYSYHSCHTPEDAAGGDDEISGLPWGSNSLKHVVSKGKAKEREFGSAYYYEDRGYYSYSGESCGDRPREGGNSRLMGESEPPGPDPADLTNAFTGLRIENS